VLLLDTGVLLAAADTNDRAHEACVELLEASREPLVTSPLVVAEAGYLIDRQLGSSAESAFYRSIANGDLVIEVLTAEDFLRMAALIDQYADFPLGGTDASLIAVAERRKLTTVATLDRRHFHAVRPQHCDAFEIVP
jgi:uncharacterized protein